MRRRSKDSAMRMDYYDFIGIVASGRQEVGAAQNQVMPAFGTNPNVMCYLDDIWTYLRARGSDAVPRGRPAKRAEKPEAYAEAEKACMEQLMRRMLIAAAVAACVGRAGRGAGRRPRRPLRLPGLRRSRPTAAVGRGRLGLREQDRRADGAEPRGAGAVHLVPAGASASCARRSRAGKCDVVMGYAQGDELVLNTNHYYTSTHVLVTRADGELATSTPSPTRGCRASRIGVVAGSPPATHVARLGLMKHAKPYKMMVDRRVESPPEEMLADVESGEIDAALLWGPIGGPLAKANPALEAMPLLKEADSPRLVFRITMGVRAGEDVWKRELNSQIRRNQEGIDAILRDAGVPILDDFGKGPKPAG